MLVVSGRLKSNLGSPLLKPFLDVRYINPHTGISVRTTALIDTGADTCVLPASMADVLGHDLELGYPANYQGVTGVCIPFYKHTMQIEIDGLNYITDNVMIAFSPTVREPILGVQTFLNKFILTINYPGKTFSLQLPSEDENLAGWGAP